MRALAAVLGGCLLLTACAGGSGDALTPLDVSQRLEEAKVPCDQPDLDRRDARSEQLALSVTTVSDPPLTVLTCEAPGGPYQVVIWETADESDAALKGYCLRDAIGVLYAEEGVEYGTALADFDRPDLGVGDHWVARATNDSIVSTPELAQALGGEVTSPDALCAPFAGDVEAVVKAEQQRLAAEAAAAEEESAAAKRVADQARFEEAMKDPSAALVLANSATTSPVVLGRMAEVSDDFRVGCTLARNASLPPTAYALLASKDYPDLVQWLSDDYRKVTRYEGQVGVCLAESDLTPDDVLQRLASSPYKDVRQAVKAALRRRA